VSNPSYLSRFENKASKSPEVSVFQQMKKNWDRLPKKDISSANINLINYPKKIFQVQI